MNKDAELPWSWSFQFKHSWWRQQQLVLKPTLKSPHSTLTDWLYSHWQPTALYSVHFKWQNYSDMYQKKGLLKRSRAQNGATLSELTKSSSGMIASLPPPNLNFNKAHISTGWTADFIKSIIVTLRLFLKTDSEPNHFLNDFSLRNSAEFSCHPACFL